MVLCSTEEITSLLTKWLQSLESLAAYLLIGSSPSPAHSPSHPTLASTDNTTVTLVDNDTASCTDRQETQMRATFEEISNAFYGETYQNLSDVVKKAVGELATLCAEMEVYASQRQSSLGVDGRDKERETTVDDTEREKDGSLTSEKEREMDVDGGITATTESDRGKDNGRTVSEKEKERELVIDSSSSPSSVQQCSCLVDFIHCYGPLLDSVRLKQQLLSPREWGERRECLAALSGAKESETFIIGELNIHFLRGPF